MVLHSIGGVEATVAMSCTSITLKELNDTLEHRNVAIFGTGYVAIRLLRALRDKGKADNIDCFVTTKGAEECIEGLPVLCVEDMPEEATRFVLIAVHESFVEEIEETLECCGIKKYLWVSPEMYYEIVLGAPI